MKVSFNVDVNDEVKDLEGGSARSGKGVGVSSKTRRTGGSGGVGPGIGGVVEGVESGIALLDDVAVSTLHTAISHLAPWTVMSNSQASLLAYSLPSFLSLFMYSKNFMDANLTLILITSVSSTIIFSLFVVQMGGEDIVKIFCLSSPTLYFEWVFGMIMIISFYLALWISNYGAVALSLESKGNLWVVLSGLPGLLSLLLYLYTVKCAVLLKVSGARFIGACFVFCGVL